jgi:hypothetical protein
MKEEFAKIGSQVAPMCSVKKGEIPASRRVRCGVISRGQSPKLARERNMVTYYQSTRVGRGRPLKVRIQVRE